MIQAKTDLLLEHLLGLLVPLLMAGKVTDIQVARAAAQQAIEACKTQAPAKPVTGELVTIAQIVAFALTALDDLTLSMAPDLSLAMKLKLRGNASALSRSSSRNTEALEKARRAPAAQPSLAEQATLWEDPEPAPVQPAPKAEPVPATLPVEQQNKHHWANAMTTAAAELQTRAARVEPTQRSADRLWVDVLNNVASELRQPSQAPAQAGLSKADLLRTTLMASGGEVPTHFRDAPPSKSKPAGR